MPPVGFEPTISAGERPKTHALDHWDRLKFTLVATNVTNGPHPTPPTYLFRCMYMADLVCKDTRQFNLRDVPVECSILVGEK